MTQLVNARTEERTEVDIAVCRAEPYGERSSVAGCMGDVSQQ